MDPKRRPECNYCYKTFASVSNRNHHERRIHLVRPDNIVLDIDELRVLKSRDREASVYTNPQLRCNYCDKAFSTVLARKTHVETAHYVPSCSTPNTSVTCSECSSTFPALNIYREHLHQAHHIVITRVEHEFASEEEFLEWKERLEMDVGVNYTRHSGPKKVRHGSKQTYYCRRSGTKRLSPQSAGKINGTCKIGQFCTSSIDVLMSNGRIQVSYFVDHRDHEIDSKSLVHMKLPKCDKDEIAGKPANLEDKDHPDWAPTQNPGHNDMSRKVGYSHCQRIQEREIKVEGAASLKKFSGHTGEKGPPATLSDTNNPDLTTSVNFGHSTVVSKGPKAMKEVKRCKQPSKKRKQAGTGIKKEQKKVSSIDEENHNLREEIEVLVKTKMQLLKDIKQIVTFSSLNESKTKIYTGLSSAALTWLANLICGYLREFKSISPLDQLLLTLMKLRLGVPTEDLAYRFGITEALAYNIIEDAVSNMYHKLRFLIRWPSEELMPGILSSSRKKHEGCVVIDCIEFPIEKPFYAAVKAQTWSNCKEQNTIKALLGVSQSGSVVYVSKCWGGGISNKELVLSSGFLDNINCGDVVVACRDFIIADDIAMLGATLKTPPATPEGGNLTREQTRNAKKLSAMKQAFERIKTYKILSDTLAHSMLGNLDRILFCCSALSNLQS